MNVQNQYLIRQFLELLKLNFEEYRHKQKSFVNSRHNLDYSPTNYQCD